MNIIFFLYLMLLQIPGALLAQSHLITPDGNMLKTPNGRVIINTSCELLTIFDADGNEYHAISIGTQCWLGKNLATTKYNDGTPIPNVTDDAAWGALTTGAYCDYNNTPANSMTYGRLYNWYVVDNNASSKFASNGGKNICPAGWHVSTRDEWIALAAFLGGQNVAGGKLKEIGFTHWLSPNTGATNETGFTALPNGYRGYSGSPFDYLGYAANWWTSSYLGSNAAYVHGVFANNNILSMGGASNVNYGIAVRCIAD